MRFPTELPRQRLQNPHAFWISRYPITVAQWCAWPDGPHTSLREHDPEHDHPNQPITSVTHAAVVQWCAWLQQHLRVPVHLPTALEWEMAAGGPDGLMYPWGNHWKRGYAAVGDEASERESAYAPPIGCFPAGAAPCGAEDLIGGHLEWTRTKVLGATLPHPLLNGKSPSILAPFGDAADPAKEFMVIKGAMPMAAAVTARTAAVWYFDRQLVASSDLGFRIIIYAHDLH